MYCLSSDLGSFQSLFLHIFFSFLPSGTPTVCVLIWLLAFHRFLRLCSLFIFFSFTSAASFFCLFKPTFELLLSEWKRVMSNSLWPHGLWPFSFLCPWNSPGKISHFQVAFSFSRGSSQPRDQTQVSCIKGRIFISWATREAQNVTDFVFMISMIPLFYIKENKLFKWIYASNRRRQWHPTLVLLPEESHGRRSLVGCSPWSL